MVTNMKLGASTARFWSVERDLQKVLAFISEHFKVAEVWIEPPFFPSWRTSREKADLDRLQDILVVTELETTIHAPYHDLSLCSWNPAVTSLAQKEIEKSLEMAAEMDSKAVTFHMGRLRLNEDEGEVILRANLEALDDMASEYSAKLCLENPHDGCYASLDNILELTEGLPNIYLTLDLAHLSLHKTNLGEYKKKLRRKVKNIHISGITSDGRHKPLVGVSQYVKNSLKTMRDIRYKGAVILEGFVGDDMEGIVEKEKTAFKRMVLQAGLKAAP